MRLALSALALTALFCGCSGRTATAPPPAVPLPAAAAEGLVVSLTWDAPVDLDLYVTDPTWESLYFANNPTRSGARLENDARCDTLTRGRPPLERARITDARPGPYRVGVDFIDRCGTKVKEVGFHVTADFAGVRREARGKVAPNEFRVIALEFELPFQRWSATSGRARRGEVGQGAPSARPNALGDRVPPCNPLDAE